MWLTKPKEKKNNRRRGFRIYEQANLLYQKLQHEALAPQPLLTAAFPVPPRTTAEQGLPDSRSQENATLNVNISTSGIAFTCEEPLQSGDHLMIRVLLLPSMTEIVTCCKVVYCRPSNPFENDRHPFAVGAVFINLTENDGALLNRHIERRRKQQWIVNGLLTTLILSVLASPEQAWSLIVELSHYLLEIGLHLLHLGFEYLEMGLDHIVEHLFHTGLHETQIIVFYVLLTLGLLISFFMLRPLPRACRRWYQQSLLFCWRKQSSCLYYWGEQTLGEKIRLLGLSTAAVVGYVYLTM